MDSQKRTVSPMKCRNELAVKKPRLEEPLKDDKTNNYSCLFEDCELDFDLENIDALSNTLNSKQDQFSRTELDLTKWTRCVVQGLERDRRTFSLILDLREDKCDKKKGNDLDKQLENTTALAKCYLQDLWCHTNVEVGDVLSVIAIKDSSLNAFKVNKTDGFCVINPDILISGTTVVGSLFCKRRAVLQERFRGIDANNKVMVIGSIVHELVQETLSAGLKTLEQIENMARTRLDSEDMAFMLYSSLMTRDEAGMEVQKYIPNIAAFIEQYVEGVEPHRIIPNTFGGIIEEIADIEENIWTPQLGLKGKIDVSVRIHRRTPSNRLNFVKPKGKGIAIPLELKTGRATFSMEHKGQLILYQLMMSATGAETNSGLLLYLREGIMREVHGTRNEQRDLIMLRNELAYYLSRLTNAVASDDRTSRFADGKWIQPFELPEPISHHSACSHCPYSTLCCTFVRTDPSLQLHDGHPLNKVMKEGLEHLKDIDYEYFIHWCFVLVLEEQEAKTSNYMRALWTETAEGRQKQGRAIVGLHITKAVIKEETRFLHEFEMKGSELDSNITDLTLCGFSNGEYVVISSEKRLAIAAGRIANIAKQSLNISLERDLTRNYADQTFIIDRHESQNGSIFNFTNLGILLDNTTVSNKLRSIIIDRQPPIYCKVLPKVLQTKGKDIFEELNGIQRAAVLKALRTDSYMLIKGLPGTGKTQTLVAIVRLLRLMGKTVLITSHTHSAVDNLLLRLHKYSMPMLRLGSDYRLNPQLQEYSESRQLKDCRTEEDLCRAYDSFGIVAVTCLGASHAIFLHRRFDYCIVDEATQVMQPTVLRPLFYSAKFILVGDPDQLPPLIRSKEARLRGADESLFQRLDTEAATSVLTLQYRMNKTITRLANELTYDGALQCANAEVQAAALKLQLNFKTVNVPKWLQRALQSHIDQAVFLLDTLDCSERSYRFASSEHNDVCSALEEKYGEVEKLSPTKSRKQKRFNKYTNHCEAAVIFHIVRVLLQSDYDPERIGIIAPYRAQVELLKQLKDQHQAFYKDEHPNLNFSAIEVNTVDQYQGRDKDIILYSGSKTGGRGDIGDSPHSRDIEILEDKRRLTVAITRSKYKLILIGDSQRLAQYMPFKQLLKHIPSFCRLKLEDGKLDFSWEQLLQHLSLVVK